MWLDFDSGFENCYEIETSAQNSVRILSFFGAFFHQAEIQKCLAWKVRLGYRESLYKKDPNIFDAFGFLCWTDQSSTWYLLHFLTILVTGKSSIISSELKSVFFFQLLDIECHFVSNNWQWNLPRNKYWLLKFNIHQAKLSQFYLLVEFFPPTKYWMLGPN